ncbi:hypothetical protein GGI04_003676 [Coemansia thaxteri]|nr:hypothetical protein GGI04_003676 [Coemansia thaxteri]
MEFLLRRGRADINEIFDPTKVPGSSVYMASNGTDLGMQAIFAASFFLIIILLFSALRLRWPYIFSPRTRLTITAPPFLSKRFFGWFLATMRTPETHILNTLGLDAVIFLRFYKMCMRLLLDIAFFSLVIIWPINIVWSKTNLNPETNVGGSNSSDGDLGITLTYSVTDYLFNLTLNTNDPKQKWNLVPHIFFVYVFSGLAYYHISKFSSRWASLRWHFLMQSRHALVSRTVMLTGVPRHLASSPRELEWFWGPGLQLGKVERVRVCPFNTRLTSSARARARYLIKLEHAYKAVLGNPCAHPEYDPEKLRLLAMDPRESARAEERLLLAKWAKHSKRRRAWRQSASLHAAKGNVLGSLFSAATATVAATATPAISVDVVAHAVSVGRASREEFEDGAAESRGEKERNAGASDSAMTTVDVVDDVLAIKRPRIWVRAMGDRWAPWERVDAIDYWRTKFLTADKDFRQLRDSLGRDDDAYGQSTTAFVTFADAASAHMVTQLSCYPNPGNMKAKLAPEPRGVYWPNIWISSRRKWAGFTLKWVCVLVIWAFWSVPVILFSSLLTPASLAKIFPSVMSSDHNLLRSFLSSTVPSVFLLLFLNMLPWILKQVHFVTGVRTKPDIDYSVMTKMWAFLVFNVILVFGFSGTFWNQILNVVNNPGTVMQSLASNIPRVGTFFTGYILVLGVGYQPFKLLQLRPVVWHIGRQWLCSTPRDYARLVSPVYIDWYSVYPYPLLVFAIAMIYSTFSPPVVVGAVIYFVIGYPVMKYLLLYVYFHPFETAGMAWPKVCRRMILSVILYQIVLLTFVIVRGGGWYTFSMVPIIMLYLWFFYHVGWSLEKQGTVLPVYLWRNPPPNSSYPQPPPDSSDVEMEAEKDYESFFSPYDAGRLGSVAGRADLRHLARMGMGHDEPVLPPPMPTWPRSGRTSSLPPGCRDSSGSAWLSLLGRQASAADSAAAASGHRLALTPAQQQLARNKVAKRTFSHHRRESSRGVRTREIILSGRSVAKPGVLSSGRLEVGSGGKHSPQGSERQTRRVSPLRRDFATAGVATNSGVLKTAALPPGSRPHSSGNMSGATGKRQVPQRLSPSRRRSSGSHDLNKKHSKEGKLRQRRRKRYKSLAEAATVEGSRLIMSLGKLPSELYSRHSESRRNSMIHSEAGDPGVGRGSKRWSLSGKIQMLGRSSSKDTKLSDESLSGRLERESIAGGLDSAVASTEDAVGSLASTEDAVGSSLPGVPFARVRLNSPLANEVVPAASLARVARSNSAGGTAPAAAHSTALLDGSGDEWSDADSDGDSDSGSATRQPMAPARGQQTWQGAEHVGSASDEWDPLVYLKPTAASGRALQAPAAARRRARAAGTTLGTLLTDLEHGASLGIPSTATPSRQLMTPPPLQRKYASNMAAAIGSDYPDAASGLRRRRAVAAARIASVSSGGYSSGPAEGGSSEPRSIAGAAASIIEAERSRGHDGHSIGARMRARVRRIRDYFLADFRPAGPILDLTYDRLFSQGAEDVAPLTDANGHVIEDNGDTLPPLRQILEHVLPRSVSRTFLPSEQLPISPEAGGGGTPATTRMRAATTAAPPALPPAAAADGWGRPPPMHVRHRSELLLPSPLLAAGAALGGGGRDWSSPLPHPRGALHSRNESLGNTWPAAGAEDGAFADLPRPPRAPWLPMDVARSATQPSPGLSRPPSSALSPLHGPPSAAASAAAAAAAAAASVGGRRTSHKNSLPPPRVPLPARVVSELNYAPRHSTASASNPDWPLSSPLEDHRLLIANYQRFAVEAQSTFEPDECTDYSQTPMLNFRGILDRGIQDYVHPGLVGELPTLWLPVKAAAASGVQRKMPSDPDEREQTPSDAKRLLALAAAQRLVAKLARRRGGKGRVAETADAAHDVSARHEDNGSSPLPPPPHSPAGAASDCEE